ncbi:MAG: hypothetical protein SVX43_08165 [Cyanobacteriota bacterium]|nr:hypothetical protein [Cyanobacteriota bacterium]
MARQRESTSSHLSLSSLRPRDRAWTDEETHLLEAVGCRPSRNCDRPIAPLEPAALKMMSLDWINP